MDMHQDSSVSEIPLPITYTPTTHRISKAKKGKRVHACEYPGCTKIFTRAEHRRRHELNHSPEAMFRCTYPGCDKAFHRPDLLARHLPRHELEAQMEDTTQWNQQMQAQMMSEASHLPECMPMNPYLAATQQSSMSVGGLVSPDLHPDLVDDLMWDEMDMHVGPEGAIFCSQHIHESVEDSHFYSTPETCPSPASDGPTLSYSSHPRSSLSPSSAGVIDWDPSEVPIAMGENLIQPPLQCEYPSPTWTPIHHGNYDEHHVPSDASFQAQMNWKSWPM